MNNLKSLPGHWFRFNLRTLLAVIVFVALGLTALKLSNPGWAAATATVTAGVLLFALLGWMHGREARRAYWSGFAVCGWGYLALIYVAGNVWHAPPGNQLATNDALEFMFRQFNPESEKIMPSSMRILGNPYPISYPAAYYAVPSPMAYAQPAPVYAAPATVAPSPSMPAVSNAPSSLMPAATDSSTSEVVPASATSPFAAADDETVPTPSPSPSLTSPPPVMYQPAPAPIVYQQPTYSPYGYTTSGQPMTPDQAANLAQIQTRAQHFPAIGNCLFALILGWVGAVAASGLSASKRNATA